MTSPLKKWDGLTKEKARNKTEERESNKAIIVTTGTWSTKVSDGNLLAVKNGNGKQNTQVYTRKWQMRRRGENYYTNKTGKKKKKREEKRKKHRRGKRKKEHWSRFWEDRRKIGKEKKKKEKNKKNKKKKRKKK